MLESLKDFDISLFLFINGKHHPLFDFIMYWASVRWTWIPMYLLLLVAIAKKEPVKNLTLLLVATAVLIAITDQLSVLLFKNYFLRLRPCHNFSLQQFIHLVGNCGGKYGFISSHATNCFALLTFLLYIFNKKIHWMKFVLIPWVLLVSYSRIYNGVHYPADVAGGAIFGSIVGTIIGFLSRGFLKSENPIP